MSAQPQNPTPFAPASVVSNIPDLNVPKVVEASNSKVFIVIFLFILVIGLSIGGYYFLIFRQNQNQEAPEEAIPTDAEFVYENEKFGFSVITPKSWEITPVGNKVVFYGENDGVVNFEAFVGEEFQSVNELDEQFCESFEKGFREGLSDTGLSEQFNFELFSQNGLTGCRAEGQIVQGYYQKYNVYFDSVDKQVYTLFYTIPDEAEDSKYEKLLSSFQLLTQ